MIGFVSTKHDRSLVHVQGLYIWFVEILKEFILILYNIVPFHYCIPAEWIDVVHRRRKYKIQALQCTSDAHSYQTPLRDTNSVTRSTLLPFLVTKKVGQRDWDGFRRIDRQRPRFAMVMFYGLRTTNK